MQIGNGIDDVRRGPMIGAVVIAAGASYRMGSPKALLKIEDKTFLQHVVDVLRSAGVGEIVVVLGSEAATIKAAIPWFDGEVIVNKDWEMGQLTSINSGIDAFSNHDVEAALICPVDHPLISNQLVVSLLSAFRELKKGIILPVFHGRRGHPVLFSSGLFGELRKADLSVGARQVVRVHAKDVHEVETEERGIVINIDTPEDYRTEIIGRS